MLLCSVQVVLTQHSLFPVPTPPVSPWPTLHTVTPHFVPVSLTPFSFSLSSFPFSHQIKKSLSPDLECSWRDEGKNLFSIPSFVFFCSNGGDLRQKKSSGYSVNLCLSSTINVCFWIFCVYLLLLIGLLLFC